MESAIPRELQCPRTHAMRMAAGYAPPSPAWTARWPAGVRQVVMAYLGVQCADVSGAAAAFEAASGIAAQLRAAHTPLHHDLLHYIDEAGYTTYLVVAYWNDSAVFETWMQSGPVCEWWASPQRLEGSLGFFREVYRPRIEDFETLSSTLSTREGVANLSSRFSDEVREHAYWGGARDRLAIAQTNALAAAGELHRIDAQPDIGRQIRIAGHANLTLIRSGQNWSGTHGTERDFYLQKLEPVLRRGMEFLRDEGLAEGCYFNRYMRHVDASGTPIEKSLGLSAWRSLGHLEKWAESHLTHKAIFGSFLHMLDSKDSPPDLRLYHEVSVLQAEEQSFEYLNCHPRTGLVKAANFA